MGAWLGIDGGGTKTACTIYSDNLKAIESASFPTCHYAQAGELGMKDVLRECVSWAEQHGLRADAGIGFGICGFGEGAESDSMIRTAVESAAGNRAFELVNDVDAAWASGLMLADGIALIAGTGSIALGVRGGRRVRCGGWDYLIGDEGSGGWIGKQVLSAFTRQCDGRDAKGPLYTAIKRELGLDNDFELISFAQRNLSDRTCIASLSVLAADAALAGDDSARSIFDRAGTELAEHVRAIASQLFDASDRVPVAYIGGVFNCGALVLDPLADALPDNCQLTAPLREPALGPVLILRDQLGRTGRR